MWMRPSPIPQFLGALVSYPDPHRSCGWITRSGDVIHPQLRCGSGYETIGAPIEEIKLSKR